VSPRGNAWYFFVLWVARHIALRLFSGGLKIIGRENIPEQGPVILAPNHVSNFDPPVVSCGSPRAVVFLAKEELFKPPVFGPFIRSLNAFPVKRGAADTGAVRLALDKLAEGHCLIIFPEGTRGDGLILGPMQTGIAMLAKRSGALVVPTGVYGTHKILPKGRKLPGFSRLRVAYGKPFSYAETATTGDDKLDRARFLERLEGEILAQCRLAGLEVRTATGPGSSPSPGSDGTAP
jgi:1-acyl-sn-glycerol-3-phosphate acyltransferase